MTDVTFDFHELTDFQKKLLAEVKDRFPSETKKFLQEEAKKLKKIVTANSKTLVKKKTGNYLKGIKTGKVYKRGGLLSSDTCIRVYNDAPHAHLIETGHKMENGGRVQGRYVLEKSQNRFNSEFTKDCSAFLEDFTETCLTGGK